MSDHGVHDAMIVAGGRGTRLRPLTDHCPKPLVPFCGEPFLVGVLRRLADVGVRRVFLVVGADTSPFDDLIRRGSELGLETVAVPEPTPLDTAGGVRAAVERVDGTMLVLNGDVLTDVDLAAAIAHHRAVGADATLVLTEVEDTSAFGVCVREGTRIVDFVEKPAPGTLPDQHAINAGTYVLEPSVLLAHPNGRLSFERQVFPELVARGGHLEGFVWGGAWADLGTPERLREGTRLALDGALAWPSVTAIAESSPGIRVAPGATVDHDAILLAPVLIHDGAYVAAGATVGPHAVLGPNAVLGEGANMVDGSLFDEAGLGADVHAHGLLAGVGAHVESGARLGYGVVLGDGIVISEGEVLADDERRPAPQP